MIPLELPLVDPICDSISFVLFLGQQGGQSISLEPGGQFELSGAPFETLHQVCVEVDSQLNQVR